MSPSKYTHIPTSVEAMQWTGENLDEIQALCGKYSFDPCPCSVTGASCTAIIADAGNAVLTVRPGDWIVSIADGAVIERYAPADFVTTFQPELPAMNASAQELVGGLRYGITRFRARTVDPNAETPSVEYVLEVVDEYLTTLAAALETPSAPATLTAVMWHDRHADPTVHLFSDREKAEAWARKQGHDNDRHGEYREETYPDNELAIYYSCESDRLEVVTLTVDAELADEAATGLRGVSK